MGDPISSIRLSNSTYVLSMLQIPSHVKLFSTITARHSRHTSHRGTRTVNLTLNTKQPICVILCIHSQMVTLHKNTQNIFSKQGWNY